LPVPDANRGEAGYVAPRTEAEQTLARIWAEVLGVDRVGVLDDFFDLGGHSLLATRVISRMRDAFGIDLPLRLLFEAPRVEELAARVASITHDGTHDGMHDGMRAALPPLLPRSQADRERPLPLSYAQQRLWFLDRLESGNTAYNIPAAVRLSGGLDAVALRRALNEVVCRHEVLRTHFATEDGEVVQRMRASVELDLPLLDLSALPDAVQRGRWTAELARQAATSFDLSTGPLIRAALIRLAATEHIVSLTMHHIAADGWSAGVLVRELAALYRAFSRGEPSPLAPLPIQYADYAHWQRAWLAGDRLEQQLAYWREQLSDAPPLLSLPTDRPRPAMQRHRGATLDFAVDAATTAGLYALARRVQGTLFMPLAAVFGILLSRHASQDDICIGTPIANRRDTQTEDLIGMFVNMLVLRQRIVGHESFETLLARTRETTLGAYMHQDMPFEQLVEALRPQRSLGHSPLFQAMLVLQNTPPEDLDVPGLRFDPIESGTTTARFDLTLNLDEVGGRLLGSFEYDVDLFDRHRIGGMAAHFLRLLEAIVDEPRVRVDALPMLSGHEQRRIVEAWNATGVDYPSAHTLPELFEAQAARTPDAVALVAGDARLSYAELDARANRLAHHLRTLGVGPDVRVALGVERSAAMIVGLLGILKAGGAYVPLDPAYPREWLAYMLDDAAPAVLVTEAALREVLLPEPGERAPVVVCLDADAAHVGTYPSTRPAPLAGPEHLAYVIYTSGSTGRPKGVCISHRALLNLLDSMQRAPGLDASDTLLAVTSLSFDIAALELYLPLISGARLVLASRQAAG
ncbi:condensation domain-containing protein, partial [Burkholderia gladioli]|uniref:condensation domain-containing protein n=1 Tax=Burkholderia gladioli TaxID=28095 RepID=UPI00163ED741